MSSERDAVKRVVEAFERSDWSEIDVRFGSLRVHLSTNAGTAVSGPTSRPQAAVPPPDPSTPATSDSNSSPPSHSATSANADVATGTHVVTSPSPGIFWCAPEPGARPFTAAGERVDASSTVCIVEVMKLMNHVKAGVAGTVVAIFVDNGVAVEKGEALVAVIPDADRAEM